MYFGKNNDIARDIYLRVNKIFERYGVFIAMLMLMFFSGHVHADGQDLLANALEGDVKQTIGSSGKFWKIFVLFDIVLAASAAVKTKNPLVFGGTFITAFIPAILLKAMVF